MTVSEHRLSPQSGLFGRHHMLLRKTHTMLECSISLQKQQTEGPVPKPRSNFPHHDFPHYNLQVSTLQMKLRALTEDQIRIFMSPVTWKNFLESLLVKIQKFHREIALLLSAEGIQSSFRLSTLCIRTIWAFLENLIKSKPAKLLSHL